MISAFGVDHGGISKSLKPHHHMAMARVLTGAKRSSGGFGDARSQQYVRARLAGNKAGAQKAVAQPGNRDPRGNPDYSPTSNGFKIAFDRHGQSASLRRQTAQARASYVEKSFVPGKGYKAAKDLDHIDRHIVRNKAMGNRIAARRGKTPEKTAPSAKGRKIWEGIDTKRGKLTPVIASRAQTQMPRAVQGFSQPDGRGGGRLVIHDDADFKTTRIHELEHIKPRRNPVRMRERFENPTRLGREEGRADFRANGNRATPGSYPGSADFQRGYNETQGKMAAARRKDRK